LQVHHPQPRLEVGESLTALVHTAVGARYRRLSSLDPTARSPSDVADGRRWPLRPRGPIVEPARAEGEFVIGRLAAAGRRAVAVGTAWADADRRSKAGEGRAVRGDRG
jgi:hypothetical protein